MQQVEVEMVCTKPPQTGFAGQVQAPGRSVVRIGLADQKHLVPLARDRFPDQLFCSSLAIHFGGIDQGHAQLDPFAQSCDLSGTTKRIFGHHPCALA
jgi:hypothetical protein